MLIYQKFESYLIVIVQLKYAIRLHRVTCHFRSMLLAKLRITAGNERQPAFPPLQDPHSLINSLSPPTPFVRLTAPPLIEFPLNQYRHEKVVIQPF